VTSPAHLTSRCAVGYMIATGYSGNQMQHGEFTPGPCRVTSDGGAWLVSHRRHGSVVGADRHGVSCNAGAGRLATSKYPCEAPGQPLSREARAEVAGRHARPEPPAWRARRGIIVGSTNVLPRERLGKSRWRWPPGLG
jgi:hypothetical protein